MLCCVVSSHNVILSRKIEIRVEVATAQELARSCCKPYTMAARLVCEVGCLSRCLRALFAVSEIAVSTTSGFAHSNNRDDKPQNVSQMECANLLRLELTRPNDFRQHVAVSFGRGCDFVQRLKGLRTDGHSAANRCAITMTPTDTWTQKRIQFRIFGATELAIRCWLSMLSRCSCDILSAHFWAWMYASPDNRTSRRSAQLKALVRGYRLIKFLITCFKLVVDHASR